jgi:hypothetical protein
LCIGLSTITTQAVAARMPTCEAAAPHTRASAPAVANSRIAAVAANVPAPEANAVRPPHSVESSAKLIIEAKRMRLVPAASARQVQKAPMAAHANNGSCSRLPSTSIAVDAHAARRPSDRFASSTANDTIHTGRRRDA